MTIRRGQRTPLKSSGDETEVKNHEFLEFSEEL